MAKISPIEFSVKSNNEYGYKRFVIPCFVYSDGTFKAQIEDEHVQDCVRRDFAGKLEKGDVRHEHIKGRFMVGSQTLAKLTVYLKNLMEKDLESTVTEEILLAYTQHISAFFWRNADGDLSAHADKSEGEWVKLGRADFNDTSLSFSVGAVCIKRTTYTNHEGSSVKHSIVSQGANGDNLEIGPFGNELTRWCRRFVRVDALDRGWGDTNIKLIPYTEKAAEFFYNLVYSTALLCDKAYQFLADETMLSNAIADSNLPRLMGDISAGVPDLRADGRG